MTDDGLVNADVRRGNEDGVTVRDALFIQRYLLDLETLPPIEYYDPDPIVTTVTTTTDLYYNYYFAVDQVWSEGVS